MGDHAVPGGERLKTIIVLAVAGLVALAAIAAYSSAVDPHRLINPEKCTQGNAQNFWQPFGTWEVNGFLAPNGRLVSWDVHKVDKPAGFNFSATGIVVGNTLGDLFHDTADVWVETTVQGPGNVSLIKVPSEKERVDFSIGDQFTNKVRPGSWTGPTICFPQSGQASWEFVLIWQDVGGKPESFDRHTMITNV